MNIDRYMVNLFFEIKRNIPIRLQSDMKISNPNIGRIMTELYQETDDENIKLLTRIFLERAGGDWIKEANKNAPPVTSIVKNLTIQDTKAKPKSAKPNQITTVRTKTKRIYRGQIVED